MRGAPRNPVTFSPSARIPRPSLAARFAQQFLFTHVPAAPHEIDELLSENTDAIATKTTKLAQVSRLLKDVRRPRQAFKTLTPQPCFESLSNVTVLSTRFIQISPSHAADLLSAVATPLPSAASVGPHIEEPVSSQPGLEDSIYL